MSDAITTPFGSALAHLTAPSHGSATKPRVMDPANRARLADLSDLVVVAFGGRSAGVPGDGGSLAPGPRSFDRDRTGKNRGTPA